MPINTTAIRITEKGHKIQERLLYPNSKVHLLLQDGGLVPFILLGVVDDFGKVDGSFDDQIEIHIAKQGGTDGDVTEGSDGVLRYIPDMMKVITHFALEQDGYFTVYEVDQNTTRPHPNEQVFAFKITGKMTLTEFTPITTLSELTTSK